ncbi:hypothetical protein QR98_0101920 [Sarcoptes scabiei]|uniref:Uncharacterized protein n=1 Tax=Sarcoptes scabiei TaxID=52283 RepID=A0A132AL94_SARSC|nr:hypothetical protein QR98_0101920 [Sarcoptes scabiei]
MLLPAIKFPRKAGFNNSKDVYFKNFNRMPTMRYVLEMTPAKHLQKSHQKFNKRMPTNPIIKHRTPGHRRYYKGHMKFI